MWLGTRSCAARAGTRAWVGAHAGVGTAGQALMLIHGVLGTAQQIVDTRRKQRVEIRESQAERELRGVSDPGMRHPGAQQDLTARRALHVRRQCGELVAAEPPQNLVDAVARKQLAQKGAHLPDEGVAGGMARRVVDLLQLVQVEVNELVAIHFAPGTVPDPRPDLMEPP